MCESMTYPKMLPLTDRLDYLLANISRHALCLCIEEAVAIEMPSRALYGMREREHVLDILIKIVIGCNCLAGRSNIILSINADKNDYWLAKR